MIGWGLCRCTFAFFSPGLLFRLGPFGWVWLRCCVCGCDVRSFICVFAFPCSSLRCIHTILYANANRAINTSQTRRSIHLPLPTRSLLRPKPEREPKLKLEIGTEIRKPHPRTNQTPPNQIPSPPILHDHLPRIAYPPLSPPFLFPPHPISARTPNPAKNNLNPLLTHLSFFLHPWFVCSLPSLLVVFLPGWVGGWG